MLTVSSMNQHSRLIEFNPCLLRNLKSDQHFINMKNKYYLDVKIFSNWSIAHFIIHWTQFLNLRHILQTAPTDRHQQLWICIHSSLGLGKLVVQCLPSTWEGGFYSQHSIKVGKVVHSCSPKLKNTLTYIECKASVGHMKPCEKKKTTA